LNGDFYLRMSKLTEELENNYKRGHIMIHINPNLEDDKDITH